MSNEVEFKPKLTSSLETQKMVDLATLKIKVTNKTNFEFTVKPAFVTVGGALTEIELIIKP